MSCISFVFCLLVSVFYHVCVCNSLIWFLLVFFFLHCDYLFVVFVLLYSNIIGLSFSHCFYRFFFPLHQ